MKQIVYSEPTLDHLALEEGTEIVLESREYSVSRTIRVDKAVTISGNGATLIGNGLEIGFIVSSSNVVIKDLNVKGIANAFEIDSEGQLQEHVTIDNVHVELISIAVQVGSSKSNGVMRDIHIRNCTCTGKDGWEENELAANIPYQISAATSRVTGDSVVGHCLLEDAYLENCSVLGGLRLAVDIVPACPSEFNLMGFRGHFNDNTIKGLHILNCYFEQCWDGSINVIGNTMMASNGLIDGLEISGNKAGFGIAGIYIYANEPIIPVAGSSSSGTIRNVLIRGNELTRAISDVGEPTRAVFLGAGRSDYYEGNLVENGLLENIEIVENIFDGAGPVIVGCYALLDGCVTMRNNRIRNVYIHNNLIKNADYAFTFEACQVEGRRYDWNFGFPRHDKKWLDEIMDDSVSTNVMEDMRDGNRISGRYIPISTASRPDIPGTVSR